MTCPRTPAPPVHTGCYQKAPLTTSIDYARGKFRSAPRDILSETLMWIFGLEIARLTRLSRGLQELKSQAAKGHGPLFNELRGRTESQKVNFRAKLFNWKEELTAATQPSPLIRIVFKVINALISCFGYQELKAPFYQPLRTTEINDIMTALKRASEVPDPNRTAENPLPPPPGRNPLPPPPCQDPLPPPPDQDPLPPPPPTPQEFSRLGDINGYPAVIAFPAPPNGHEMSVNKISISGLEGAELQCFHNRALLRFSNQDLGSICLAKQEGFRYDIIHNAPPANSPIEIAYDAKYQLTVGDRVVLFCLSRPATSAKINVDGEQKEVESDQETEIEDTNLALRLIDGKPCLTINKSDKAVTVTEYNSRNQIKNRVNCVTGEGRNRTVAGLPIPDVYNNEIVNLELLQKESIEVIVKGDRKVFSLASLKDSPAKITYFPQDKLIPFGSSVNSRGGHQLISYRQLIEGARVTHPDDTSHNDVSDSESESGLYGTPNGTPKGSPRGIHTISPWGVAANGQFPAGPVPFLTPITPLRTATDGERAKEIRFDLGGEETSYPLIENEGQNPPLYVEYRDENLVVKSQPDTKFTIMKENDDPLVITTDGVEVEPGQVYLVRSSNLQLLLTFTVPQRLCQVQKGEMTHLLDKSGEKISLSDFATITLGNKAARLLPVKEGVTFRTQISPEQTLSEEGVELEEGMIYYLKCGATELEFECRSLKFVPGSLTLFESPMKEHSDSPDQPFTHSGESSKSLAPPSPEQPSIAGQSSQSLAPPVSHVETPKPKRQLKPAPWPAPAPSVSPTRAKFMAKLSQLRRAQMHSPSSDADSDSDSVESRDSQKKKGPAKRALFAPIVGSSRVIEETPPRFKIEDRVVVPFKIGDVTRSLVSDNFVDPLVERGCGKHVALAPFGNSAVIFPFPGKETTVRISGKEHLIKGNEQKILPTGCPMTLLVGGEEKLKFLIQRAKPDLKGYVVKGSESEEVRYDHDMNEIVPGVSILFKGDKTFLRFAADSRYYIASEEREAFDMAKVLQDSEVQFDWREPLFIKGRGVTIAIKDMKLDVTPAQLCYVTDAKNPENDSDAATGHEIDERLGIDITALNQLLARKAGTISFLDGALNLGFVDGSLSLVDANGEISISWEGQEPKVFPKDVLRQPLQLGVQYTLRHNGTDYSFKIREV